MAAEFLDKKAGRYTTKFPAGHPGFEGDYRCPIYTPDGGVLMATTPADAARIAQTLNELVDAVESLGENVQVVADASVDPRDLKAE